MRTIFVSSTFKDMHFERDAIQEIALPILKNEAIKYGENVSFCDLRWGINTGDLDSEAGAKKVLDVCLDEIDRCKPPMVVILGDRYGWIPSEALMKSAADRKRMELEDLQISVTALEIAYGALSTSERCRQTLFYFRHIESDCPCDYSVEDAEHEDKLNQLKAKIDQMTDGRIKHYSVQWMGDKLEGVIPFAEMLAEDIKQILLPEWKKKELLTPFERERLTHWSFISEKNAMFSARGTLVKKYFDDLTQNKKHFLAIKAPSGSGKSMLFSNLALRLRDADYDVVPFISGLTSESNDSVDILRNTIYYLEELLGFSHEKISWDFKSIENTSKTDGEQKEKVDGINKLRERLFELCVECEQANKRVVIMVDAIDQLTVDDNRDNLIFIPEKLSPNVKFVMTCLPELGIGNRDFFALKPINDAEKREVINGILQSHNRELEEKVIRKMIRLKASKNPLFLSLLVQRLLMMNRDDFLAIKKAGDDMKAISKHQLEVIATCPDSLQKMSAELLTEAGKRINEELVRKVAEYLAVSRHGLRQEDLAILLGDNWSALDFAHFITYMDENFIQRDDGRFDFSHKCIREGFLKICDNTDEIHRQIVEYLESLPLNDNIRMLECVYHYIALDDKARLSGYIHQINGNVRANELAAKDLFTYSMSDGGKWFCDLLVNDQKYGVTVDICQFVNLYFDQNISGTLDEMRMRIAVLDANVQLADRLANEYASSRLVIADTYVHYAESRKDIDSRSYNAFSQFPWQKTTCYQKAFDIYNKMHELIDDEEHIKKITAICTNFSSHSHGYNKNATFGIMIARRFLKKNRNIFVEINLVKMCLTVSESMDGLRKPAFILYAVESLEQIERYYSVIPKSARAQLADAYSLLSHMHLLKAKKLLYIRKYFELKKESIDNPNSLNGKLEIAGFYEKYAFELFLNEEWNGAVEAYKAAIRIYQQIYSQYGLKNAIASVVKCMCVLGQCYLPLYGLEMEMATYRQAANYLFESLKEDVDLLYVFPEITWIEGNSANLKLWFKMLLFFAKLSYQRFVKKEKLIMPQYPLESLYNKILNRQGNFDCLEKSGVLRYKISRLYIQSHKKHIRRLKKTNNLLFPWNTLDELARMYGLTRDILRSTGSGKNRLLSVFYAHKAISLMKKSKRISGKKNPKDQGKIHMSLPHAYGEIGYCYELLGLKKVAVYYYKSAISLYEHEDYKKNHPSNNDRNGYITVRLANIYYQQKKTEKGDYWFGQVCEGQKLQELITKQPPFRRWECDCFLSNGYYIYGYTAPRTVGNWHAWNIPSIHEDPSGALRRRNALKQIADVRCSLESLLLIRISCRNSYWPDAYKYNLNQFIEDYRMCVEIDKKISERFSQTDCRHMLALDYNDLMILHLLAEDLEQSLYYGTAALAIFDEMIAQSVIPENNQDISTLYRNIGEIHGAYGGADHLESALKCFLKNVELDEKLYAENRLVNPNITLMLSYRRLAMIYECLNEYENAKIYYGKAFMCMAAPSILTTESNRNTEKTYLVSILLECIEKDYLTTAEKQNCVQKAIEVLNDLAITREAPHTFWCPLIVKDLEERVKELQP